MTLGAVAAEQPIFNGTDLSGWEGNTELWSVKDGAIRGETRALPDNPKRSTLRHNTFLVWKGGSPSDFELRAKFRITSPWGNSGIQYRSKVESLGPDGPVVSGYQADFETGKTYTGILYEEKGRGLLALRGQKVVVRADEADPRRIKKEEGPSVGDAKVIQEAIRNGEWNEYKIVAKGKHLEHFVNGMKTVDVTDEDPRAAGEGVIALQMHFGEPMVVEFKELILKTDN